MYLLLGLQGELALVMDVRMKALQGGMLVVLEGRAVGTTYSARAACSCLQAAHWPHWRSFVTAGHQVG